MVGFKEVDAAALQMGGCRGRPVSLDQVVAAATCLHPSHHFHHSVATSLHVRDNLLSTWAYVTRHLSHTDHWIGVTRCDKLPQCDKLPLCDKLYSGLTAQDNLWMFHAA